MPSAGAAQEPGYDVPPHDAAQDPDDETLQDAAQDPNDETLQDAAQDPNDETLQDAAQDANDLTLHGERLTLRRARDDDRGALGAILCEPAVVRWWGAFDPDTAFDELSTSFVIVVDGAVAGWLQYSEEAWWQYPSVSFDIALTR